MSDNAYLAWLVAMAIATVTVLTVGTLIASGIIRVGGRQDGSGDATPSQDQTSDAEPRRELESTRRAA